MPTQNASNQEYTNNADGFTLSGGTTKRDLIVTGADITLTGSGSNTYTYPSSSDTLVGRTSTDTLTNKWVQSRVTSISSSGTPTINTDNCDAVDITALAAAITSMTTNLSGTPVNFQKLWFRIKDNGTARTITWGSSYQSSGVAALPTTTVTSKTHEIGFIYNSTAAKWVCVCVDVAGY